MRTRKKTKMNKEKIIQNLISLRGDRTQKEVADALGISQSYISRLEKRIMLRLKKEMLKNGM